MDDYNIPSAIKLILPNYLDKRKIIVENNRNNISNIGVSQGWSCGPVLWLLVINKLLESIENNKNFQVIVFADGIYSIMKSTSSSHFKEMVKTPITFSQKWAKEYKLNVNISKSMFTID